MDSRKSSRMGTRMGKRAIAVRGNNAPDGYFSRSQRPLEILCFLLPLIAFYEIGLALVLRSGGSVTTNEAHKALLRVFDVFGLDGAKLGLPALCLPGVMLVVVLLSWQALARLPWRVDGQTILVMFLESAALAVPLFLGVQVIAQVFSTSAAPAPTPALALALASSASTVDPLRELSVTGKIAISIGAGLYEELVFRMGLIAVLHTLFVDALRWREKPAIAISVVVSAAAFVLYHPLTDGNNAIDWRRTISLSVIAIWFGSVYALRGFGIVVGTHAAYDIAALLVE